VKSLAAMLVESAAHHEIAYLTQRGCFITRQRNELARDALEWGADYVLWIDADQKFPAGTLARLLAHGKSVVGCNIARRESPSGPTAGKMIGGTLAPVWTPLEKAQAGEMERVAVLGFGVILTAAQVLRDIGTPQFETESEDYHFCLEARKAGHEVWLDHALSWEIGHIHETVLRNIHANMDRARYLMSQRTKAEQATAAE
jgi:hypothetical protein